MDKIIDNDNQNIIIKHASVNDIGDHILLLCHTVITKYPSINQINLSHEFIREILTIPMVTFLFSTNYVSLYCTSSAMISSCIQFIGNNPSASLALPPSPHPVFQSGQWLLGNLCSLLPHICILPRSIDEQVQAKSPSASNKTESKPDEVGMKLPGNIEECAVLDSDILPDEILSGYVNMIIALVIKYNIPGILQGRNGVVWDRQGKMTSLQC
jgi:hypothetical protein